MTTKKEETASFMLRFTQKIFENENGEPQVQWRGHIRHVQRGEEKRFSDFEDVISFIQDKLAELTFQAIEDKSPEEQKGILAKSFDLWKKVAFEAPKIVVETIRDPKKQVAQLQDQLQDQITQVKDEINQKIESSGWVGASKADSHQIMEQLEKLSSEMNRVHEKLDKLNAKGR